jgi:hypothetical protein
MSCGKGKYGVEQWRMLSSPNRHYKLEMSPFIAEIKLITLANVAVPSRLSIPNATTLQQSIEVSKPLADPEAETWAFQK